MYFFSFKSLESYRDERCERRTKKKKKGIEEGTNIFVSDRAIGCRYSCKGELVAWEVAPQVTIEKR